MPGIAKVLMQRYKGYVCQRLSKIVRMKNWALFFAAIYFLAFSSCTKKTTIGSNKTLVGKWVLSKSFVCDRCSDANPVGNNQTIVFTSDGRVELSGSVGDTEQHYSGTYSVTQQPNDKILNITLDAPAPKDFLYIPGSI